MLFKILQGDSSRISTDITPLHPGWCYFTSDDGKLYIDSKEEDGTEKRTCINSNSGGTSKDVSGILTKSGWVNGQQILPIEGLQASQNGIICIAENATDEQQEAAKYANLKVYSQTDGFITISASGIVPQIDIPVSAILLA